MLSRLPAAQLAEVVDWMSELCAPTIASIELDRTQLGDVILFFVEQGGARLSARSASDGSLRFLGLIVALFTAARDSIIILARCDELAALRDAIDRWWAGRG